jgi:hypothetical protein
MNFKINFEARIVWGSKKWVRPVRPVRIKKMVGAAFSA